MYVSMYALNIEWALGMGFCIIIPYEPSMYVIVDGFLLDHLQLATYMY